MIIKFKKKSAYIRDIKQGLDYYLKLKYWEYSIIFGWQVTSCYDLNFSSV